MRTALAVERLEYFFLLGPGIVKLECHKALPWLAGFLFTMTIACRASSYVSPR